MHKNQHTRRKLLNYEFYIDGKLSKIGHHCNKNMIHPKPKITITKKCAPKLGFFNEKKIEKVLDDFDIEN